MHLAENSNSWKKKVEFEKLFRKITLTPKSKEVGYPFRFRL